MISKDDIKKLAELARIEISDQEQGELALEIDSILGFVAQVKEISGLVPPLNDKRGLGGDMEIINVLREDSNSNESGKYTSKILAEMPKTENGYLKVKKIL